MNGEACKEQVVDAGVFCAAQELVTFRTVDPAGADIYHTNVMMAIGTDVAVVCAEAVPDAAERAHLLERLRRHHTVLPCLPCSRLCYCQRWC